MLRKMTKAKEIGMKLSDRLLYFVSEDIDNYKGTEVEILKAQRRILEVGVCFLSE